MSGPSSIVVDSKGNIIVGNGANGNVQVFDNSLAFLRRVNSSDLKLLALDESAGLLFKAGTYYNCVGKIDYASMEQKAEELVTQNDNGGMAFDPKKNLLYLVDMSERKKYSSEILKLDTDTLKVKAGSDPLIVGCRPFHISVDHTGHILASVPSDDAVYIFDPNTGERVHQLEVPSVVATSVAKDGTIYAVSLRQHKVYAF